MSSMRASEGGEAGQRGLQAGSAQQNPERGDLRLRVGAKWAHVERAGTVVTRCAPCRLDARGDIRSQRRGRPGGAIPCAQRGGWLAVVRVGARK
eukprot:6184063-Pleurochrysis_carterae.AAC.1